MEFFQPFPRVASRSFKGIADEVDLFSGVLAFFCADLLDGFGIAACAALALKVEAINAVAAAMTTADDCLFRLFRDR
ncbi:hypothetical protein GTY75_24730 [Streptomyces sp. SID8381]|uniref:hypothetical protein n=1 Tax=unclassified Streptomyces TaxID=2593676 RepID=UPI00131A2CE1|nr:hypothetical protein [Streptomyces sp. Amel2xE9]MYX29798.1 hypothetical protein [Streptomyces sp. SID8381]